MAEGVRKLKVKKGEPPPERRPARSAEVMVKLADQIPLRADFDVKTYVGGMTESEIITLIDEGAKLDQEQKNIAGFVRKIKDLLLVAAEVRKFKEKAGRTGSCRISPSTKTEMKATALARVLKEYDKVSLFDDLTGVKIGEVKRYLGEQALEGVSKTEIKEYGSISLKLLKK